MSLLETMKNRQPEARDQGRNPHRLYPSLPNVGSYDIINPDAERLPGVSEFHVDRQQENTQPEVTAATGNVRRSQAAQIQVLEEQREELFSINEKWAKEYHSMVQYYQQKVRNLKELLSIQFDETAEDVQKDVITCKRKKDDAWIEDISSVLLRAEEEANELRAQNDALTRRGQHQHEEIRRLNKALEEALSTRTTNQNQDIWKHQAEVYKEDFLTERKDREKLKAKNLELESQYQKVRGELRVLRSQVTLAPQVVHECICIHQVKLPNQQRNQRRS